MSRPAAGKSLDAQIAAWRTFVRRRVAIHGTDADELEDHLRDEVAALRHNGLDDDEAFLIAVKRLGDLDAIAREFAREHSGRLWKQLVSVSAATDDDTIRTWRVVACLAVLAAAAVKLPALFGVPLDEANASFYARNASLFVLPLLTAYFVWHRGLSVVIASRLFGGFALAAVVANSFPFEPGSDTEILLILHLPISLWLLVGVAHTGGAWGPSANRMNFVRFTGELFIYFVLIALGGGVLIAFTLMMFATIQLDAEHFVAAWLLPCGAAGAFIVAAWLVEAKQSVIENMAPVLTRLFTPMFAAVCIGFLAAFAWTGNAIDIEREVLIGFDLLLVVVVGLVVYAVSARDPALPPNAFDALQLLLVVSALAVDAVALTAIVSRISEFGFTPNRVAALGENLILLANLAGSAWLYVALLRQRRTLAALERWQTAFLPVYALWAAFVVLAFPPVFGFR